MQMHGRRALWTSRGAPPLSMYSSQNIDTSKHHVHTYQYHTLHPTTQ